MKIQFAILTVSDRSSRGEREDVSGKVLQEKVLEAGHHVQKYDIVPDDIAAIQKKLKDWADDPEVHVIITTGGTGFAPRDVTPEATRPILERLSPGVDELIRQRAQQFAVHAMLSRAISGVRGKVFIINFPGSPKACKEDFNTLMEVLPHAVALLHELPPSVIGH